jgi:hypothetical protein
VWPEVLFRCYPPAFRGWPDCCAVRAVFPRCGVVAEYANTLSQFPEELATALIRTGLEAPLPAVTERVRDGSSLMLAITCPLYVPAARSFAFAEIPRFAGAVPDTGLTDR